MQVVDIENVFKNIEGVSYIEVKTDGHHFELLIVANQFEGQSLVARNQWVYKYLNDYIISGKLHAIQMQTYTPLEWEKKHG